MSLQNQCGKFIINFNMKIFKLNKNEKEKEKERQKLIHLRYYENLHMTSNQQINHLRTGQVML